MVALQGLVTLQGLSVALLGLVTGVACAGGEQRPAAAQPAEAVTISLEFEREVRAAASAYKSWSRVSDHASYAPWDCMAPRTTGVQRSASDDTGTHGRKLYFLFAKDPATYDEASWRGVSPEPGASDLPQRLVGQVLVKESWTAVESAPPRDAEDPSYLVDGDKFVRTGEQRDLFVMLKLDPTTPGTDEGWVYGTLTPDGKHVTSSGRIAACMQCHVDAGFDRLFGSPRARATREALELRASEAR